ncbi:MAG: hypothetical protein IT480_18835 [Gammaproteobacteria bacterium]|nr:hypothetical protein [Gammaproteobacteria bacterium]
MNEEFPTADAVLEDPSSSFWLKASIRTALERDPVDALNDAIVLASLLEGHLREVFALDEER